jgi:hypothetical protein
MGARDKNQVQPSSDASGRTFRELAPSHRNGDSESATAWMRRSKAAAMGHRYANAHAIHTIVSKVSPALRDPVQKILERPFRPVQSRVSRRLQVLWEASSRAQAICALLEASGDLDQGAWRQFLTSPVEPTEATDGDLILRDVIWSASLIYLCTTLWELASAPEPPSRSIQVYPPVQMGSRDIMCRANQ